MNGLISFLPTVALLVTLAAIFTVLFLAVLKILKSVSLFQGRTAVIMAVCVAVLSIVGLAQLLVAPRTQYGLQDANQKLKQTGGYVLLPYVALAVAAAVILSQLLLIAGKVTPEKPPECATETQRPVIDKAKLDKRAKRQASSRRALRKDEIPF
jgi:hypothetical protein